MPHSLRLLIISVLAFSAAGCLFDDWFDKQGSLKLSITDAPIDSVQQVRLSISAIDLKPDSKGVETVEFDPPVVINNLLDLSGGQLQTLLSSFELPAGDYEWLRLHVVAGDGDSFVVDNDGNDFDLYTPGQLPSVSSPVDWIELPLPFDVSDDELLWLVLDIDLRKSLGSFPVQGYYVLRPSFRLVDIDDSGAVSGEIDAVLLEAAGCTSDTTTGLGNAVYVFSGTSATPGDIYVDANGTALDALSPYATSTVQKQAGVYSYKVAYLPKGSYTLAVTCDALGDDPLVDDATPFAATASVTVTAGGSEVVDF